MPGNLRAHRSGTENCDLPNHGLLILNTPEALLKQGVKCPS
jgi:hypothetical protein